MKKLLLCGVLVLGLLPAGADAAGTHSLNGYAIKQQDYGGCTLANPCPVPSQAQVDDNTAAIAATAAKASGALPAASAGPLATQAGVTAAAAVANALGYTPYSAANPAGYVNAAAAAAAAPVQSVGGNTGSVTAAQISASATAGYGYTPVSPAQSISNPWSGSGFGFSSAPTPAQVGAAMSLGPLSTQSGANAQTAAVSALNSQAAPLGLTSPVGVTVSLPNLGSRTGGAYRANVLITDPTGEAAPNSWNTTVSLSANNTYEVLDDHELTLLTNGNQYTQEEHTTPGYFHAKMLDTIAGGSANWLVGVIGMAGNAGLGTLNNAAAFVAHIPDQNNGGVLTNFYAFYADGCGSGSGLTFETNCYGISLQQGMPSGFGTPNPLAPVHIYGQGPVNSTDWAAQILQDYGAVGKSQGVGIYFMVSGGATSTPAGEIAARYDGTQGGYVVIGKGASTFSPANQSANMTDIAKFTAPTGTGSGRVGINLAGLPAYNLDVNGTGNISGAFTAGTVNASSVSSTFVAASQTLTGTVGVLAGTLRSTTTINNPSGSVAANSFFTTVTNTGAVSGDVVNQFDTKINTGGFADTSLFSGALFGHAYGYDSTTGGTLSFVSGVQGMADNEGTGTVTTAAAFLARSPAVPPGGGVLVNRYGYYDNGCVSAGAATNCYGIYEPQRTPSGFGTPNPLAPVHIYGASSTASVDWAAALLQNYGVDGQSQGVGIYFSGANLTAGPLGEIAARYDSTAGGYVVIGKGAGAYNGTTQSANMTDIAKFTAPGGTNTGRLGINLATLPAYTLDVGGWVNALSGYVVNGGITFTANPGVPSSSQPSGSYYARTDGSPGARIYISNGGGSWTPIPGV